MLGQFLAAAGFAGSPPSGADVEAQSTAASSDRDERVIHASEAFQIPADGVRVEVNLDRPSPWAYLGRRFKALWEGKEAEVREARVTIARSEERV